MPNQIDASLLKRLEGVGDPSLVPVFIVGMPRSGSTLVEQILASHPQVHAAGELTNLNRVVQSASNGAGLPFPACIARCGADDLRRLGADYLARLPALPDGKTRIIDKAPGNFLYVGLIYGWFCLMPGSSTPCATPWRPVFRVSRNFLHLACVQL